MNLYWKSLFGGLMSTAKYEDKLHREVADYNRFLLISESKELEEYNELYKQVKSSNFKELKRTLRSRKYKDTQEYRDMAKFKKLDSNSNLKVYFQVLDSKDLADYLIDIASRDDAGQIYKIYENYRNQRILQDTPLTVVLTTMHKVKGLEFDVVITTPSFAGLPLRPHREYEEGENPNVDDNADMDEERRLMFVAYTRAKKRLIIYKAERERALSQSKIHLALDYPALRYTEPKPGMDKYYLSYTAQSGIFEDVDSYVLNHIKKDDPVEIRVDKQSGNYYIVHNGHKIGRLSSKSTIRLRAKEDGKILLKDFFVSNIFVWTYEDTLASDERAQEDFQNNPNKYKYRQPRRYALDWSEDAKTQGYINIVQIAGFGTPNP